MTAVPEQKWEKQWAIFHEALDLPHAGRAAFVDAQCANDTELRDAIRALLVAHEASNPALGEPAIFENSIVASLDPAELLGESIGHYVIRRVLGEGGMGVVYLAEQMAPIQRNVALKLVRLGMDSREVIARFESERQALAKMNHPNVAQVIDAGATDSGRPYFVMEYIDGAPITDYCDAHRLNTAERLALFLNVCAGVQHAHQKGIIHRDLKPTNVLVAQADGKPVPKIIDFGVAKATAQRTLEKTLFTQAGMLIGTPEYMSPEQAGLSNLDVDTRTDVYSLGVLLFELLVGALPFEPSELRRAGYDEMRRRIREDEPARPSAKLSTLHGDADTLAQNRRTDGASLIRMLRGDLDWITMRALAKAPDRRYSSPHDLAADLQRHMRDEPVTAGRPTATYRLAKFARRNKLVVIATCAVAVSLIAGIVAATYGLVQARQSERVAREEARTSAEVSDFLAGLFRNVAPSERDADSVTAREVLDRGVQRIREELSGEPAVQSRLMLEMGKVYAQLGLLPEAQRLYEEASEIRQHLTGVTAMQRSESVAGLAGVKYLAGEHSEAIALYEEAIELLQSSDEQIDTVWLATIYRSLGGVLDTLAKHEEALAALHHARSILKAAGLSDEPEYGRVMRNIGMSYWATQDMEAARSAYEESLDVYDHALEPGHPEISYVVNSLAILNYNLKDFAAARPMFERELANLERTLGPEHRNTASIMNNLGLLLLEMGLIDEAKPYLEKSMRIREDALGSEHEEVATSACNLAKLRLAGGELVTAVARAEQCLTIREKTLGPAHPFVASALDIYAEALMQSGDVDQARTMQQRASDIRESQRR